MATVLSVTNGEDRDGPCIMCRETDGGFGSVEHVVPESMGNTELILPRGVVCDRCNSGHLARLDQVLCEFPAVKIQRILMGQQTKRGKHPRLRFSTGYMQQEAGKLQIRPNEHDGGRTVIDERREEGGGMLFANVTGGPRLTDERIGQLRAGLLKMALESVWLEGQDFVMNVGFDHVRRLISGELGAGFVLVQSEVTELTDEVRLRCSMEGDAAAHGIRVAFDYFGWKCFTHSRRLLPLQVPPGYRLLRFDFRPQPLEP